MGEKGCVAEVVCGVGGVCSGSCIWVKKGV